jgi:hypothetical protein
MEVKIVNDISVDVNLVFKDSHEEFDSSDESDQEEKEKKQNLVNTFRRYAAIFTNGKLPDFVQKKVNPLASPKIKDEGKRNQKIVKLEKYFGYNSRNDFYGRSNWIKNKIHVMNEEDNIAEKVQLTSKKDHENDFAFAPRRPVRKRGKSRRPVKQLSRHNDTDSDDGDDGYLHGTNSSGCGDDEINNGQRNSTEPHGQRSCDVPSINCDTSLASFESASTLNTSCSVIETGTPTSPRSRYIGNCLNSHLNPRAALILRKDVSYEMDLSHQVQ